MFGHFQPHRVTQDLSRVTVQVAHAGVRVQWTSPRMPFSSQPPSREKGKEDADERRKRQLQSWQTVFWLSGTFLEDASCCPLGWAIEFSLGLPWEASPVAACCGTCVPEVAWPASSTSIFMSVISVCQLFLPLRAPMWDVGAAEGLLG